MNSPVSVESYPPSNSKCFISVICGSEASTYNAPIALPIEYFLSGVFDCDMIKIDIWPNHRSMGFWLRGRHPLPSAILGVTRFGFLAVIVASFVFLFRSGKQNSIMRSVLIIQIAAIFILDPLYFLIPLFPRLGAVHSGIACFGWWRSVSEIFEEVATLGRWGWLGNYRICAALPAALLLIAKVSHGIGVTRFPGIMAFGGIVAGMTLPVGAFCFLKTARKGPGSGGLARHVWTGGFVFSMIYGVAFLPAVAHEMRESVFCESVEITFAGTYAIFQTILRFMAGSDDDQSNLVTDTKFQLVAE